MTHLNECGIWWDDMSGQNGHSGQLRVWVKAYIYEYNMLDIQQTTCTKKLIYLTSFNHEKKTFRYREKLGDQNRTHSAIRDCVEHFDNVRFSYSKIH